MRASRFNPEQPSAGIAPSKGLRGEAPWRTLTGIANLALYLLNSST